MKTFQGKFIRPAHLEETAVTIVFLKEHIRLGYTNPDDGLHQTEIRSYKTLQYEYQLRDHCTYLNFGNKTVQIAIENNIMEAIHPYIQLDDQPWVKKTFTAFRLKMAIFLASCIGLLWMLYILFVPYLSQQLAKKLPKRYEISIGSMLYSGLVDSTKIDPGKTSLMNAYWKTLQIESAYPIQITVIRDATVNAFAIMGGHIVVYTGLLNQLPDHEALAALLCHEFTHIQNRHTTKTVFRSLGSKVFLSLLFGKFGSLSDVVINNTAQFSGLHYSRKLEKEADLDGLELLRKKQIDGHGFIGLFSTLENNSQKENLPEILSSHPDLKERMQYIQQDNNYSNQKDPELHYRLENIFLQLQQKEGTADF